MQILIKHILHIAFVLFTVVAFGQTSSDAKKEKWKTEKKKLKYRKGEKYKGPDNWYGTDPTNMKNEDFKPIFGSGSGTYGSGSGYRPSSGSGSGYQPSSGSGSGYRPSSGSGSGGYSPSPSPSAGSGGSGGSSGSGYRRTGSRGAKYNPQQIQRDRQKRYGGVDRGGGSGTLKNDPKVKRPDPIKSKNNKNVTPKAPQPNKKSSSSSESSPVWKMLLYLLLIAAVCVIIFLIVRGRGPKNQKIVVDVQNEWNPEVISKTELELKLEAAMERGDYRECVRIYFTFILKELIRKGWIRWKKEKTNHHYVMEMGKQKGVLSFMECVRIYDLVWYGDYDIDEDIFEMLKPTLESYYKSLDPVDE